MLEFLHNLEQRFAAKEEIGMDELSSICRCYQDNVKKDPQCGFAFSNFDLCIDVKVALDSQVDCSYLKSKLFDCIALHHKEKLSELESSLKDYAAQKITKYSS